jgi:hypothetical protein
VGDAREGRQRTAGFGAHGGQVGGIRTLASELNLSEDILRHYVLGKEPIPEGLMLQIIDVLLEQLPEPPKAQ